MKLRNNISGGLAIFSFERRDYPENWDKCEKILVPDNGLDFTLDQNPLIFSKILSHLCLGGLKNARLVCRQWDQEASPILARKCAINFEDDPSACNASLKFFRYVHAMKNLTAWPNWKITLPTLPPKESEKYVTDLNWFLTPKIGHDVKTLSLNGRICSDQTYRLYLDTVSHLKDTLEELWIHFDMEICHLGGTEKEYSQREDLFFPVLKKFSVRMDNRIYPNPTTLAAPWMKTWTDAITRVKSISTIGYGFMGSRFLQEMGTTGTLKYQNLREIRLTCKSEEGINFLTELNQPLKKLTVTLPLGKRYVPDFEDILKKFAPSLEFLSFRVASEEDEEQTRFVLNLPCFPKLKSLDLCFGSFMYLSYFSEGDRAIAPIDNVARLCLAFPPVLGRHGDDSIDYARHLPVIRSIVVAPEIEDEEEEEYNNYFWDTYSDLIDSLLPKEGREGCETLQNLVLLREDVQLEERYRQAARLPGIFQNVRNEWMVRLREQIDN